MDVQKRYYSTREVQQILSVSRSTANAIMHMFEKRGQLLRFGNTLRVEVKAFDNWCKSNTAKC